MKNEFAPDANPYEKFKIQFEHLTKLQKDFEAQTYAFHDEFLRVFLPDQKEFDDLKDQAKIANIQKKSQQDIDAIYLKMCAIYKKWLPIEEILHATNPAYKDLFNGLKYMLKEIEGKSDGKSKTKSDKPKST